MYQINILDQRDSAMNALVLQIYKVCFSLCLRLFLEHKQFFNLQLYVHYIKI